MNLSLPRRSVIGLACLLLPLPALSATPYDTFSKVLKQQDFTVEQVETIERAYAAAEIEKIVDRVVGGVPALHGEFPYAAALVAVDAYGNHHQFCGGTLISERTVLTAAHCRVFPDASIRVVIGHVDLSEKVISAIQIESFTPHPDYRSAVQGNDIAIVRLAAPAPRTPLPPLELQDAAEVLNTYAWAIGWGATSEGGPGSSKLMKALLPMVSLAACKTAYPDLPTGTLCAGSGGTDACQGDSGGPLLRIGAGQRLALTGITSYGEGCARPGFPGVFTAISHHKDFIATATDLGAPESAP